MENNSNSSVVWRRGESFGREEKPYPIILKKWNNESKEEASYWSAAQSQNSVLNYHTVTQNTLWKQNRYSSPLSLKQN